MIERTFRYKTSCVECRDGDAINAMVAAAVDVTYRTMQRHCDLADWAEQKGYVRNSRHGGLTLKNDWAVSYHKSVFRGRPCYYVQHSLIEYIFTEDGA